MKILNEKTVSKYVGSASKPTKTGYLLKRGGEYTRSLKRRYFVLVGNILAYYEKQSHHSQFSSDPIGVIILEGQMVEVAEDVDCPFAMALQFPGADLMGASPRVYILGAESAQEQAEWMTVLSRASWDWYTATVDDLEDQLAALDQTSSSAAVPQNTNNSNSSTTTPPAESSLAEITRFNPFNETSRPNNLFRSCRGPNESNSTTELNADLSSSMPSQRYSVYVPEHSDNFDEMHETIRRYWVHRNTSSLSSTSDSYFSSTEPTSPRKVPPPRPPPPKISAIRNSRLIEKKDCL